MHPCPPGLYEQWRAADRELALREPGPEAAPEESLLQAIWAHQRLRRDALRTFDGQPVVVLHPGFPNREPGPDFRHAVLQIGPYRLPPGDVEVDLRAAAWRHHGHARNPAFRAVRLHVVWTAGATEPDGPPVLPLADALDAPLAELRDELSATDTPTLPEAWRGTCAAPLAAVPDPVLAELLNQAALTRLRLKAARLAARARLAGWDQALWEALFGALGYKHNVWPLRRLAELRPVVLAELETRPPAVFEIQARLLGLAGLLPDQPTRRWPDNDAWLRRAWDVWWRWRERVADLQLPPAVWRRAGNRPANHPQRRIALAAHWLAEPNWPARWPRWLADAADPTRAVADCFHLLQPGPDPFWEHRFNLTSAPQPAPLPLLGAARATDLTINVLLPWLFARARAGDNAPWAERVQERYLAWPAAQDNSVLRLARQRLLAARPLPRPTRAAAQQGLLQIVGDFCARSNALCEGCRFPARVRGLVPAPRAP